MTKPLQHAKNEEETKHIACNLARTAQKGDIYCLLGTLGAGKTAFARYFIQSLIGKEIEVPSPTFTLLQTYEAQDTDIWHFDLYRLNDPDELYELGWEDVSKDNICLIEWPDKAGTLIPPHAKHIYITINDDQTRTFEFKGFSHAQ